MTELETLARAKMYMEKLSQGIDPVTDTAVPAGDSLRSDRLSRCFYYVSQVLGEVIAEKRKDARTGFVAEAIQLDRFVYSDEPIGISELTRRVTATAESANMKNIPAKVISDWLAAMGLIEVYMSTDGKERKRPTADGQSLGIISEERISHNGSLYRATLYSRRAQQFIIDNFDGVLAFYERVKNERRCRRAKTGG